MDTSHPAPDAEEPSVTPEGLEAFQKGVDLLAARPHFEAELRQKLGTRGFEELAVSEACDRLKELGYLDDQQAADTFARQRVGRKAWGPHRLRAELVKRRVEEAIIETVVRASFPDGEMEVAQDAADAWLRRGGAGRDRLARYLSRRGFSKGPIVEILSGLEMPDEEF